VTKAQGCSSAPAVSPEGDVWIHTLMLLISLSMGCSMTSLGALLHDIGKRDLSAAVSPGDRIRFNGQSRLESYLAPNLPPDRFSNDETAAEFWPDPEPHALADTPDMKAATLKDLRLSASPSIRLCMGWIAWLKRNLDHYEFARERYEPCPPKSRPRRWLTGRELIAEGYQPGTAFKTMLHAVEEAQLEGSIHSCEEALALIRRISVAIRPR